MSVLLDMVNCRIIHSQNICTCSLSTQSLPANLKASVAKLQSQMSVPAAEPSQPESECLGQEPGESLMNGSQSVESAKASAPASISSSPCEQTSTRPPPPAQCTQTPSAPSAAAAAAHAKRPLTRWSQTALAVCLDIEIHDLDAAKSCSTRDQSLFSITFLANRFSFRSDYFLLHSSC